MTNLRIWPPPYWGWSPHESLWVERQDPVRVPEVEAAARQMFEAYEASGNPQDFATFCKRASSLVNAQVLYSGSEGGTAYAGLEMTLPQVEYMTQRLLPREEPPLGAGAAFVRDRNMMSRTKFLKMAVSEAAVWSEANATTNLMGSYNFWNFGKIHWRCGEFDAAFREMVAAKWDEISRVFRSHCHRPGDDPVPFWRKFWLEHTLMDGGKVDPQNLWAKDLDAIHAVVRLRLPAWSEGTEDKVFVLGDDKSPFPQLHVVCAVSRVRGSEMLRTSLNQRYRVLSEKFSEAMQMDAAMGQPNCTYEAWAKRWGVSDLDLTHLPYIQLDKLEAAVLAWIQDLRPRHTEWVRQQLLESERKARLEAEQKRRSEAAPHLGIPAHEVSSEILAEIDALGWSTWVILQQARRFKPSADDFSCL